MASLALGVRFLPSSTGTGDFIYSSTLQGYRSPTSALTNGKTYRYRAENGINSEWEFGTGTWNSGTNTLSRTTVAYSSTGSKVNFTSIPYVAIIQFVEDVLQFDDTMSLTNDQKSQARTNLGLSTVAASGSYDDLTNKPSLGTAASKNTGTSAGNVVEVQTGGKLPALDGSDLTNISVSGSVRYDTSQSLSSGEKAQARTNIGVDDAVDDPWRQQPIGVPIPILDNIVGVAQPPTSNQYRYIKLTASDAYNTGVLTSESVTGSAPLVVATAVISLAGSPINGQTVNLINTERRFLRAGSAGTVQNDQMQQITGSVATNLHASTTATFLLDHAGAFTIGGLKNSNSAQNAYGATIADGFIFDSANSPGARAGTETRGKNIGVTYFMRIK